MARQKFEQLPKERRDKILSVAAEAFAKNGFAGTSYNQLLADVGLGKGSAYYYFADKQDLFLTVVTSCYRAFFESVGDVPEPTDADEYWEFVRELTERGMLFMSRDPKSAALMLCFSRERSALDVLASAELSRSVEGYYTELLRLGQRLEAVRRDVPFQLLSELARNISSTVDQWFIAHEGKASRSRIAELSRQFADFQRRLLESPIREREPHTTKPRAKSRPR